MVKRIGIFLKNLTFWLPQDAESLELAIKQIAFVIWLITAFSMFVLSVSLSELNLISLPIALTITVGAGLLLYLSVKFKSRLIALFITGMLLYAFDPNILLNMSHQVSDSDSEFYLVVIDTFFETILRILLSIKLTYALFSFHKRYPELIQQKKIASIFKKIRATAADGPKPFIIMGIVIISIIAYNKLDQRYEINHALGDIKVNTYNIKDTLSHDGYNDYFISGTMQDGSPFEAYLQYSNHSTGQQIRIGGTSYCSGNFYNPKMDFCEEAY